MAIKKELLGDNPCYFFVQFSLLLWKLLLLLTSPYPFYFVLVPTVTSNREEVRFGEVAVLKQISVLQRKLDFSHIERRIALKKNIHIPQVVI